MDNAKAQEARAGGDLRARANPAIAAGYAGNGRNLKMYLNLFEIHAKEIVELPEDWHVYKMDWGYEEIPTACTVWGKCAPIARYSDGREEIAWALGDPATERKIVLPRKEHEEWVKAWERKTGICVECLGKGTVSYSWSRDTGETRRPCKKCGATGKLEMGGGA